MARTFTPSARAATILLGIAAVALGCAMFTRYRVIENSSVGLACEAGASTLLCRLRTTAVALFGASAFGMTALVAAVLNFIRPSVVLCAIALAAAGLGIVLYNIELSALTVGLLVLSLARPLPVNEQV